MQAAPSLRQRYRFVIPYVSRALPRAERRVNSSDDVTTIVEPAVTASLAQVGGVVLGQDRNGQLKSRDRVARAVAGGELEDGAIGVVLGHPVGDRQSCDANRPVV